MTKEKDASEQLEEHFEKIIEISRKYRVPLSLVTEDFINFSAKKYNYTDENVVRFLIELIIEYTAHKTRMDYV